MGLGRHCVLSLLTFLTRMFRSLLCTTPQFATGLLAALQLSSVYNETDKTFCAGKQRKLTAWLGAVTADSDSKPAAPAEPEPASVISSQAGLNNADTAFQAPTRASSLTVAASSDTAATSGRHTPSSFTRKGSGARAGPSKLGGKAGQTSLRAFMQRPAADATTIADAVTAPNAAVQSISSVPRAGHSNSNSTPHSVGLLGFVPAGSSDLQDQKTAIRQYDVGATPDSSGAQHSTQLPQQDCSQLSSLSQLHSLEAPFCTSEQLAPDRGQKRTHAFAHYLNIEQHAVEQHRPESAVSVPESQPSVSAASDTEKAAVTAAWSKIQSKMKAPKCRGHNEDCVIREVKKNGPNKGETACGEQPPPS